MSIAKTYTAQISGLGASIITIEADISNGLHAFSVVGLGDRAVEESKDRIAAAIKNSGYTSPKQKNQKVVISLAPADVRKEGPVFDLGMAIAYLLAVGDIRIATPDGKLFLGELTLEGKIRPISGALAMTREAKRKGFDEIYLPRENSREASLIPGIKIFQCDTLKQVTNHFSENLAEKIRPKLLTNEDVLSHSVRIENKTGTADFIDISGQENAKRALEIAATGKHNIFLYGPPGTGKTMLAKALESILPPLSYEESIEVTLIHSAAENLVGKIIFRPPFRAPHHTSSYAAMIGGGTNMRPGEMTLAHKGILFMDEFPEFDRRVIDSLRQPLEDKRVVINRVKGSAEYPAECILVAAMNPCPCGNRDSGDRLKKCICTDHEIIRYKKKISGPIADRIDLWIPVGNIRPEEFSETKNKSNSSTMVRQRVIKSQEFAKERADDEKISSEALLTLNNFAKKLGLSGRGYHRARNVARTIADMAESKEIKKSHILEALQYRQRE